MTSRSLSRGRSVGRHLVVAVSPGLDLRIELELTEVLHERAEGGWRVTVSALGRNALRCSSPIVRRQVVSIGCRHHVVIDCPDPRALAEFYSVLLRRSITYESDDWVVIAENDHTSGFAFQLAPDHQPPAWPDPSRPQQFHLDVMVEDLERAGTRVVAIGGTRIGHGANVYSDPAGHPFCGG